MTPAERDKRRDEMAHKHRESTHAMYGESSIAVVAFHKFIAGFDSAVQFGEVERHALDLADHLIQAECLREAAAHAKDHADDWKRIQDAERECCALREENEKLRQTEKVYQMNRDWIADAKVEIAALKAEIEQLKAEHKPLFTSRVLVPKLQEERDRWREWAEKLAEALNEVEKQWHCGNCYECAPCGGGVYYCKQIAVTTLAEFGAWKDGMK